MHALWRGLYYSSKATIVKKLCKIVFTGLKKKSLTQTILFRVKVVCDIDMNNTSNPNGKKLVMHDIVLVLEFDWPNSVPCVIL